MFNNLKNILIGVFAAVIVVAIGASAYTALASPGDTSAPVTTASYGNGYGNGSDGGVTLTGTSVAGVTPVGNGNGYRSGQNPDAATDPSAAAAGAGIPDPQADISGASTISGTVSAYALTSLTVLTGDGQSVVVQLGSSQYAQSIGFNPAVGAAVTVTGFPGDQGLFSAISVTVDGQTYAFRDELGRPLWAGGPGKGNGRGGGNR
ncbi:MAG: hypothetical protein AB1846_06320 [Chloroflexota bacterium]